MASSSEVEIDSDYLWGDNLDMIIQLLDEDEGFNADLNAVVEEVGADSGIYLCAICNKSYKTKGGLRRHEKSKHPEALDADEVVQKNYQIHNLQLKIIIEKAAKKLSEDKCFLVNDRNVFSTFNITTDESLPIWEEFSPLFLNFKGNTEKFYIEFYKFCLPEKHIFSKLPRRLSALLCSEIATLCLRQLSDEDKESDTPEIYITEKDKECIQYLAGYCFRTLYTRIRSSKVWQSDHSQQCLSLLKAAKSDTSVQSLVDVKNRGGLWKLNDNAQSIFIQCEKEFKIFTSDFKHTIDSKLLLCRILEERIVIDDFKYV